MTVQTLPHDQPIAARIDWLFGLAERHAQEYASPEASLARQRHLARHPTASLVLKCMGRAHPGRRFSAFFVGAL